MLAGGTETIPLASDFRTAMFCHESMLLPRKQKVNSCLKAKMVSFYRLKIFAVLKEEESTSDIFNR